MAGRPDPLHMSDPADLARRYYEAIDGGSYDALAGVLAADFRHVRGDRTIEGREAFVEFMREGRPRTDTAHALDEVFLGDGGRVAVRGRLRRGDGSVWFGFVDVFEVEDGRLGRLTTYSNDRVDGDD